MSACGVCHAPITEGSGAKAIRGALCCPSCAAVYEQALAETLAWRTALTGGTSLTCASCGEAIPHDDVRAEAVLHFQGKLSCGDCVKDIRRVLLPRKVSTRSPAAKGGEPFARIRSDEPQGGGAGVALIALAVLLLGGALIYALTHRGETVVAVSAEQVAAFKARAAAERALALTTRTPETFEKANATLKEVTALFEENKSSPETESRFRTAIERAMRARDGFAPAIASRLLEQAAGKLKKADHAEEALAVLDRFPKELQGTVAGAEVSNARAHYEALKTCRNTALPLLGLGGAEGFAEMDALMASPDAVLCNFEKTEVGIKVDAERRRRRNKAVVTAATVPVTPADIASASWCELKFDLAAAEAQYAAIAKKNPERADAHLGLARIYFERDRLDLAQPYAEQGLRLAPSRADTIQVQAWLEWLSTDRDAWERTARIITTVPYGWYDRQGRRLRWLLDLGKPLHQLTHVRVFGRGVTAEASLETAADADSAASVAAEALGLPASATRLDLILFGDEAQRKKFLEKLELRNVTHEGVLLGCFAVSPNGREQNAVRLAVASGIARRAPGAAPAWLVAALPYAVSARPPASGLKVKLEELERLDAVNVLTRPDAWVTALELASLCYTEEGRQALAAYVSARKEGASPGAREALLAVHGRLAGR